MRRLIFSALILSALFWGEACKPRKIAPALPEGTAVAGSGLSNIAPDSKTPPPAGASTFLNPILSHPSPTWVKAKDKAYFAVYTDSKSSIYVLKANRLNELGSSEAKRVWLSSVEIPSIQRIFNPQLHFLAGRWYIYFTADDGKDENRRIYVVGAQLDDPQGPFSSKGLLGGLENSWVSSATVWERSATEVYMIWAGAKTSNLGQRNLHIGAMISPFSLRKSPAFRERVEAEDSLITNAKIITGKSEASGGGVVGFIDFADSSVAFTVTVDKAGTYTMDVGYDNGLEPSVDLFSINGSAQPNFEFPSTFDFNHTQTLSRKIKLNSGENTLLFTKLKNFAELDYVEVKTPDIEGVMLSVPELPWEILGEGPKALDYPAVIQKDGKIFVTYTTSEGNDKALGMLQLKGTDPMERSSWIKIGPVFFKDGNVLGPGYASFVKSPDERQDWMAFDAFNPSSKTRELMIQSFRFDANGIPDFGKPQNVQNPQTLPSE